MTRNSVLSLNVGILVIAMSANLEPAQATAPPHFVARKLTAPTGNWTFGRSLNNLGQVTGDVGSYDTTWRAFVSQPDGSVQALALPSYISSGGWVLNDAGQVAGIGYVSGNVHTPNGRRLFVYTPGAQTLDLGWAAGDRSGYVVDMNESGDVIGYWYVTAGWTNTFLYRSGSGLATLSAGGTNQPHDINNNGQVVGGFGDYSVEHAFQWDGSTFADLGTLGGPTSTAYYIADTGVTVGEASVSQSDWQGHGFENDADGGMTRLEPAGALWSSVRWITEDGFVVGQYTNAQNQYRSFYKYPGSPAEDMGIALQVVWEGVTRVNAFHEMIGVTMDEQYMIHPFYFSPAAGFHLLEDLVVNPDGISFSEALDINDAGTVLMNDAFAPTNGVGTYLFIQIRPGDLNCNGAIDFDDITPFVQILSDPAGWQTAFPACVVQNGDINGDGAANFDDINPFVELLGGA